MPRRRRQGTHVVVPGGSGGIGEAVAQAAARRGARLTLLARGADRLDAAAGSIRATTPSAVVGVVH